MPGDLAYGRRIYDWWGGHRGLYEAVTPLVFLGRERRLRDESVARLDLGKGDVVLDLACGPGPNLGRLTQVVGPTGRVVAVDYSEQMLEQVRRRAAREGLGGVETIQADAAHLPLPDASLDAALCTLGLSAIPDPEAAISEVHRCLRPGGRFGVLDARSFEGPWRVLNPLIKAIFVPTTNWNPAFDLAAGLERPFESLESRTLNGGSVLLAVARKEGGNAADG